MADYKELLRRAVEALPENNGAARRAVYEKARAALVGQLRAIHPPLPARDITTHRLQLEDCIRQVEQEASEAVIAGMGAAQAELPPPPVYFEPTNGARAQAQLAKPQAPVSNPGKPAAKPASKPTLVGGKEAPKPMPQGGTIEDIIAAANAESPEATPAGRGRKPAAARPDPKAPARPASVRLAPPLPPVDEDEDVAPEVPEADILPPKAAPKPARPLPAIVARAEAAKSRSASTAFSVPGGDKPYDAPRRGPTIEPRPSLMPAASRSGQAAVARQPIVQPVEFLQEPKVVAAMSAVREVEVEPQPADPQHAIDRAIATLDREARGEAAPHPANDTEEELPNGEARGLASIFPGRKVNGRAQPRQPALPPPPAREPVMPAAKARRGRDARDNRVAAEAAFPRARAEVERGGGFGAVTIFLIVFAVLLAGVGGAGYWAISQGYIDVSQMLSRGTADAVTTPDPAAVATAVVTEPATGPGNTAPAATIAEPEAELAAPAEERLSAEPQASTEALALAPTEERLTGEPSGASEAASEAEAVASLDPANIAGSQSLLLEASDNGTTGAVPFSGTIEWSKGTDETGLPTLVGHASIPARNLGVDVLIRKNSDTSLPASHLMEINFRVSDSFIGGSVAGLPGVLLKNEELVQGTPLVGASARVVGNSFLFALSAAPEDLSQNSSLLTERKWIDLALIYATGKRAIITLEKDATADAMFKEVFAAWGQTASN
jgi:hypothetical protein